MSTHSTFYTYAHHITSHHITLSVCIVHMVCKQSKCPKMSAKSRGRVLCCSRMNLLACDKHCSKQISLVLALSLPLCVYVSAYTMCMLANIQAQSYEAHYRRPTSKSKSDCFCSKHHANRHQYCLSILLFATHKINIRFHSHFIDFNAVPRK